MEKRYNFSQIEKQMQEFWEENQIYKFNPDAEGDIYSIDHTTADSQRKPSYWASIFLYAGGNNCSLSQNAGE